MKTVTIPRHLRAPTRTWVRKILNTYELEPHHVKLLVSAAEAWDRILQAREQVKQDGAYHRDRWGAPKSHPALRDEMNGRVVFARLLRELNLSEEPPGPRPPGLKY
jgi:phage terminase small subunit